jgi:hypothetical protein
MKTQVFLTLTFEEYWFEFSKIIDLPSIPPVGTLMIDGTYDELSFVIEEGDAAYFINDNTMVITHEEAATNMLTYLNEIEAALLSGWRLDRVSNTYKEISEEHPKIHALLKPLSIF